MNPLLTALLSIVLSVAAQFCLKAGMSSADAQSALSDPFRVRAVAAIFANGYVLAGFALYALGAVVWLAVLSKWDVSKAYPLVGLGFLATVAVGAIAGEHVSLPRLIGVLLICAGVFIVARS
ncbi:MAG TPA: hypothetical protein VHP37_24490 [Burkholderiales bacterium]|jgi:multidrug transporter EmrE-like cation transporter|nr:hypothetical protein [Burkholderiales bacterium]